MAHIISKFPFIRILSQDYSSCIVVILSLLNWGFYLVANHFGYLLVWGGPISASESDVQFSQNMAIIASVAGIAFLVWRMHFFHALYKRGMEVNGIITYSDVIRVEYEYMFQNTKYLSGNTITSNDLLKKRNYHKGYGVVLLVDPKKPKNAVIKDIYF